MTKDSFEELPSGWSEVKEGRKKSKEKVRERRTNELLKRLDVFLNFDLTRHFRRYNLESYKTILNKGRKGRIEELLNRPDYLSGLRSTLIDWGMDARKAEIKSLENFRENVSKNKERFLELSDYRLSELEKAEFEKVGDKAETLFYKLNVMKTEAKIVANTKLMHLVLPDLIMPVDREHILKFLYDSKGKQFDNKFLEIFRYSYEIACNYDLEKYLDDSWNQSVPKIIDNAIIGYVEQKVK